MSDNFQVRLVQLGRDFEKLVFTNTVIKGEWSEYLIKYKGNELLDGIFNEDRDIRILDISKEGSELHIRVAVKCAIVGKINKQIILYFNPDQDFYELKEGIVAVSDRKLKRNISFQITGVLNFDKEIYDCGKSKEKDVVSFEFTQLGGASIKAVKGSCGCTNVQFKGEKIFGQLDTSGFKKGSWAKTVTVYCGEYKRQYVSDNYILYPDIKTHNVILTIKGEIL